MDSPGTCPASFFLSSDLYRYFSFFSGSVGPPKPISWSLPLWSPPQHALAELVMVSFGYLCDQYDPAEMTVSLLKLGHKRHCDFFLVLSCILCSVEGQLPCHKATQAVLWRRPRGEAGVMVLRDTHRFFNTLPFKRWTLLPFSLRVEWTC